MMLKFASKSVDCEERENVAEIYDDEVEDCVLDSAAQASPALLDERAREQLVAIVQKALEPDPLDFLSFPDDILSIIMSPGMLPPLSFFALSQTCRRFRHVAFILAPVWRKFFRAELPFFCEHYKQEIDQDGDSPLLPSLLRACFSASCILLNRFSPSHLQAGSILEADNTQLVESLGGASVGVAEFGWTIGRHQYDFKVLDEKEGGGRDIYLGCIPERHFRKNLNDLLDYVGYSYDRTGYCTAPTEFHVATFESPTAQRCKPLPRFRKGDVLTAILDLDARTITFNKNGLPVGDFLRLVEPPGTRYFPAASVYSQGDRVELRSDPFLFRPWAMPRIDERNLHAEDPAPVGDLAPADKEAEIF